MIKYFVFILTLFCFFKAEIPPLKEYKDSLENVVANSAVSYDKLNARTQLLGLYWYESKPKREALKYYVDLMLDLEIAEEWDLAMEASFNFVYILYQSYQRNDEFIAVFESYKNKHINKVKDEHLVMKGLAYDIYSYGVKHGYNNETIRGLFKELEFLKNKLNTDKAKAIYLVEKFYKSAKEPDLEIKLSYAFDLIETLESNRFYYDPWLEKSVYYNNLLELMLFCDPAFAEKLVARLETYNKIIDQKLGTVANYNLLSRIYSTNKDYERSFIALEKSVAEAKRIESNPYETRNLIRRARNYIELNELQKAERIFRDALFGAVTQKGDLRTLQIKLSLAEVLAKQGEVAELELLLNEFKQGDNKVFLSNNKLNLSVLSMDLNILKNNYTEAKRFKEKSLNLAVGNNRYELAERVYQKWQTYCKEIGLIKEAYENLLLQKAYSDSNQIHITEKKLILKKAESKIIQLLADKQPRENNKDSAASLNYSAYFFGFIALIIAALFFSYYFYNRNKKKLLIKVDSLKARLASQNKDVQYFYTFSFRKLNDLKAILTENLDLEGTKSCLGNKNKLNILSVLNDLELARKNIATYQTIIEKKLNFEPEPFSLHALVNKIGIEVLESNPEFKIHNNIAIQQEVFLDKSQIDLAIRNLVYMALQRSKGEGRLDIVTSENSASYTLEVNENCEVLAKGSVDLNVDSITEGEKNTDFKLEFTIIRFLLENNGAELEVVENNAGTNRVNIILPKKM